ncbi:MAG: RNA-binding protein [bacterium]|nr:RNA-binding protein [bacterium]
MKIYAGNLAAATTDTELQGAFEAFGKVGSALIVTDKDSGAPKGFGFVEMADDTEANAAITGLNATQLCGNEIKVNEAKARPEDAAKGAQTENAAGK